MFAKTLEALFDACGDSQSDRPRLLIVVEEAQTFMKKGVGAESRNAAARAELAIDRIAREGRKYGINLLMLSQTIRDFSHNIASVRQNIATRIFMMNREKDVEDAAEFLGDKAAVMHLKAGEAYVCNPALRC